MINENDVPDQRRPTQPHPHDGVRRRSKSAAGDDEFFNG